MITFLLLLTFLLAQSVAIEHWCYESQVPVIGCKGPSQWPELCQENNQSPIDINTKTAIKNISLEPFKFTNYDKKESRNFENNGHTVKVKLHNGIKISGGGLKQTYKADSFHLHWSNSVGKGSEHSLDGKFYAMEMHIVHYQSKYNDVEEALKGKQNDEIAVLSFLIKASPQKHEGFQNLVTNLKFIPHKSKTIVINDFSLMDIIPDPEKLRKYYRYWGSLTTPNCEPIVVWTVFQEPIYLQENQILEFSKKLFFNKEGAQSMPMIDNCRPIQELKHRQVFFSRVAILLPHAWLTLLIPLLTYFLAVFLY